MKETTRKQIEAMKAQTIGVEIEMITRQNAAKAAADFFGSSRVEYTAARNRYMTWSTWDSQGREWKFQRDASIKARTDEEKCEMVTPILTYDDIETLQEAAREPRVTRLTCAEYTSTSAQPATTPRASGTLQT